MILLRTSYMYGVFPEIILNCNLVNLGVYMEKLCHKKMLILRYFLLKNPEPQPEKNLTPHPLENLEHPDKKLNSLGIILIP